jgi:tetratricopeptide (TPR) repeat protein
VALEATLELAHAWDAAGVADSSLAVYKRLIEALPPTGDLAARARFDRARLLDAMGHWDAARAELRALAMMQPTHPCGEAALVEIVRHHVREGESVFAAVETKHAMDTFDQLLAIQGDPGLRLETMMNRADVYALTGHPAEAQREYASAWRQQMSLPAASIAGWRAARLADSALADPVSARNLYRELAGHAGDLDVRWRARQRLGVTGAARTAW